MFLDMNDKLFKNILIDIILKLITFVGTELFIVRAFPRRLFNIQALDGVSIHHSVPCHTVHKQLISHCHFSN